MDGGRLEGPYDNPANRNNSIGRLELGFPFVLGLLLAVLVRTTAVRAGHLNGSTVRCKYI